MERINLKDKHIKNIDDQLLTIIGGMPPITLEEMEGIRLMNRTDTKFLTNKDGLLKVLALAKDKYYVQEITTKRISRYRTTYWDTISHDFYIMHQDGKKPRMKVRVRTYEDSEGLTFLEIKKKDNHGKTRKKRIRVTSQTEVAESGGGEFLMKETGIELSDLHPCLQNYFKRITLVNKGKTERLTIDFDIEFTNYDTKTEADSGELAIIELKRDGRVPSPILDIIWQCRIKPIGYSKYTVGSYITNPYLKGNMLKEKVRQIEKVNN